MRKGRVSSYCYATLRVCWCGKCLKSQTHISRYLPTTSPIYRNNFHNPKDERKNWACHIHIHQKPQLYYFIVQHISFRTLFGTLIRHSYTLLIRKCRCGGFGGLPVEWCWQGARMCNEDNGYPFLTYTHSRYEIMNNNNK